MENDARDARLEAILFFKGEPVSVGELSTLAGMSAEETKQALASLGTRLSGGIRLMRQDDTVMLATAPEYADTIERLIKEDLSKDLGKAGAETLATVLYMGPITRAGIDHIRGVNTAFILRSLTARGLVEKIPNPSDSRSMLYRPTLTLLAHLGVASMEELPAYTVLRQEVQIFEARTLSSDESEIEASFGDVVDDTPVTPHVDTSHD